MTKFIDPKKYAQFVDVVTSLPSKDHEAFIYRLQELEGQGFPTERLLTASVGMCAEAGEFTEIVKKIAFQGKPVNEENLFHLKRELGDIMWYVMQACMGLDICLNEVIEMNEDKKVTLEMSAYQAAAVRQALFMETKDYTYDPKSMPERVGQIREAIVSIDNQLEEMFKED